MSSAVFVEPVQHVFSCLLDVRFVCRVDVFSLPVDEAVSLTRKYFHLVLYGTFFLQLRL